MVNMFNPFKKIKDVTYSAFSRLDSIAETPLRLIPGYRRKQDEILKSYLNQCLNGDDPGTFDTFKTSFQSNTTKSTYMLTDTIGGYLSLVTLNPLFYLAGNAISGVNQYLRSGRLGKIVDSMPDYEKDRMKYMLDLGDMVGVKDKLHEHYW